MPDMHLRRPGPADYRPPAPFFALVVEIDRAIYDEYITRRTATRHANRLAEVTS